MNGGGPSHALHEYLARELGDRLDSRRIVVVYDQRSELDPFFDRELTPADSDAEDAPPDTTIASVANPGTDSAGLTTVRVSRVVARLARYDGSLIELRAAVEPFAGLPRPDPLLLYLPGITRDRTGSPLLELELAGDVYERPLRSVARDVLRRRFTDGQIDDLLNRAVVPTTTWSPSSARARTATGRRRSCGPCSRGSGASRCWPAGSATTNATSRSSLGAPSRSWRGSSRAGWA